MCWCVSVVACVLYLCYGCFCVSSIVFILRATLVALFGMFVQSSSFVVIIFVVDLCCALRFVIRLHKLFSYLLCCVLCFVTRFRLFLLCFRITTALCRSSCLCFHGLQWVVAVFCHSFSSDISFFIVFPLRSVPRCYCRHIYSNYSAVLRHSFWFVTCRICVFSLHFVARCA